MPTITTAQLKAHCSLQSNPLQINCTQQAKHERCIKKSSRANPQCGKQLILLIPKDYKGQGSSLNDLVGRQMNWELKSSMMKRMARRY